MVIAMTGIKKMPARYLFFGWIKRRSISTASSASTIAKNSPSAASTTAIAFVVKPRPVRVIETSNARLSRELSPTAHESTVDR